MRNHIQYGYSKPDEGIPAGHLTPQIQQDLSDIELLNIQKTSYGKFAFDKTSYIESTVGEIIPLSSSTSSAPSGYIKTDGTEYNLNTYPYLENYYEVTYGSVNHFGGDGVTTWKVQNSNVAPDEYYAIKVDESLGGGTATEAISDTEPGTLFWMKPMK